MPRTDRRPSIGVILCTALAFPLTCATPAHGQADQTKPEPSVDDAIAFITQAVANHGQTSKDQGDGYHNETTLAVLLSDDIMTIKKVSRSFSANAGNYYTLTITITISLNDVAITSITPATLMLTCKSNTNCLPYIQTSTHTGKAEPEDGTMQFAVAEAAIVLNDPAYLPRLVKALQFYKDHTVRRSAF